MLRISTSRRNDRLAVLKRKLADPSPLLNELGQSLSNQIAVGARDGLGKGTMARAFERVQVRSAGFGKWMVEIGDPAMLARPQAPRGTIRDFLKWLRKENAKAKGERTRAKTKEEKARAERLARSEVRAKVAAGRRAMKAEFQEAIRQLSEIRTVRAAEAMIERNLPRYVRLKFGGKRGYAALMEEAFRVTAEHYERMATKRRLIHPEEMSRSLSEMFVHPLYGTGKGESQYSKVVESYRVRIAEKLRVATMSAGAKAQYERTRKR